MQVFDYKIKDIFFRLKTSICYVIALAMAFSSLVIADESNFNPEAFLDIHGRHQNTPSGKKDAYSNQSAARYTLRIGYTVDNAAKNSIELTPFIGTRGVQAFSDSFPFLNNVEPTVGFWFRPLKSTFDKKEHTLASDLLRNIRFLAEYSPKVFYTKEPPNRFEPDGQRLMLVVDWYGEHKLANSQFSAFVDAYTQYRYAERGPHDLLQWYTRPGIAFDYNDMRFRIYGRWNGAYGFATHEPWNNQHEIGGGIAFHPFYGKGNHLLSNLRLYAEGVNLSYMDRNNGLYLNTQAQDYVRLGVEYWFGRTNP